MALLDAKKGLLCPTVPHNNGSSCRNGAGKGSLAAGLLIAVFMIAGWDATVYVNEEVKHRRQNPGRAAVIAVGLLIVIYTFSQIGLQGVVSPARLQSAANSGSALVYVANALGGSFWAKMMALAIALSYALRTGAGGIVGSWLFGMRIGSGDRGAVTMGYAIGASLMLVAAIVTLSLGRSAERHSLARLRGASSRRTGSSSGGFSRLPLRPV